MEFRALYGRVPANEIEFQFDYLDPADGALIQVIHTGSDDVKILGTLRGVPKGVLIGSVPKQKSKKPEIQRQLTPIAARLIALIFLCLSIGIFISTAMGNTEPFNEQLLVVLLGVGAFVTALGFFFGSRVLPPSQLSTQMTSNEPPKKAWRYIASARYVIQPRTQKRKS